MNNSNREERTFECITHLMKRKCSELFTVGKCKEHVKHSQLCNKCSKRKSHLFSLHVSDSAACLCGHNVEDSNHYLLHCPIYFVPRQKMLQHFHSVIDIHDLNVDILLHVRGSDDYDFKTNW